MTNYGKKTSFSEKVCGRLEGNGARMPQETLYQVSLSSISPVYLLYYTCMRRTE